MNRTIFFDKIVSVDVFDKSNQYEYVVKKERKFIGFTYFKAGVYDGFGRFIGSWNTYPNNPRFRDMHSIEGNIIMLNPRVVINMQDGSRTISYFSTYKAALDFRNEIKIKSKSNSIEI